MIGGATRGAGGQALARHLSSETKNESVEVGPSRGLVSDPADIRALERELERLQAHVRTSRPIHHVHCDPPERLPLEKQIAVEARYWTEYEKEFGLEGQPFYSVVHTKKGRRHVHRAYGLGRADGSVVDLSFDFARREKVARIVEFDEGLQFTRGAHNRAVVAALQRDGRQDVAAALERAGLLRGPRPRAPSTPAERAQEERTGVNEGVVRDCAWSAWCASDSGATFVDALAKHDLRLARGRKTIQIIDRTGATHDLRRALSMRGRVDGQRILLKDIRARLGGLCLPSVDEILGTVRHRADTVLHFAAPCTPGAQTPGKQPDFERGTKRGRQQIGGPAAGGAGMSSAQPPAAYDPARVGDWERYCREFARYWIQREIEIEIENSRRGQHAVSAASYRGVADGVRLAATWLAALDMGGERPRGIDLGNGRGPKGASGSADPGFPRNGTHDVRNVADGPNGRSPHGAPGFAGSPRRNGSVGSRSAARDAGEGCRKPNPDRTTAARDRIKAWHQTRRLAEAAARWQERFGELTKVLDAPVHGQAVPSEDEETMGNSFRM